MKSQLTVANLARVAVAGIALTSCSGGGSSVGGAGAPIAPNGFSNGSASEQMGGSDSTQAFATVAPLRFPLTVSPGAKGCLPKATGTGTLSELNQNAENLHILAVNLPANTDFDVFIIQVPNSPFGLSWYQGDLHTGSTGAGSVDFVGRFSVETFIVAPGVAPAPIVFGGPFPDASQNPATNPVQIYHVGIWFNSPADAVKAHCKGTETPFNGTHNAGIQVLNTATFPILAGPLRGFHP